jgi:hypothetical protein
MPPFKRYKSPRPPLSSPFRSSARDATRLPNFLVGGPHVCRHLRTNSSSTVSQAPPSPSYPLPLLLAHLPNFFPSDFSQRIFAPELSRSTPPPYHLQPPLLSSSRNNRQRGSNGRTHRVSLIIVVASPPSRTRRKLAGVRPRCTLTGETRRNPNLILVSSSSL